METAVKERLVGAAILVLLVVLVVPAVLTGPPELPPAEPDSAGPTRTVEIDMTGSQPAVEAAPGPVLQPAVPPAPTGLPSPATAQDMPSAPAQPQDDARAAPEAAVAPPVEEPAAAPQQAPAPPAEAVTAAPGSAWAVQLAALSNEASASKMVADLKSHGYSAFILEYRSGDRVLYRVRVGPEAQRDRAAALAERLKGEGFAATVVAHP